MSDYEDDFDEEVSSPEKKNRNPEKDTNNIPDESVNDDEDNTDGAFGASRKEEKGDHQHNTQHRKGSDVNSSAGGQSWLSPTERKRVGSSMAGSPEPPEYLTRRTSDKGNETKKTEKSSRESSKASSRSASAASSSSKKNSPHSRSRSRSHSSRHSSSRASSRHSSAAASAKNEKNTNEENEKEKPTTAGKDSSRKSSRRSSRHSSSSSRRSRSHSSSRKSSRSPSPHQKGDADDDQGVDVEHNDQPEFVTSVALTSSCRSSDSRKPSHIANQQHDENGTKNEEAKKSPLFSTKAPPSQNQSTLPPNKAGGRKKITPSPARPQPQPAARGAGGARERSSSTVPPPVPKSKVGGNGKRGPSPAAASPPAPPQITQRDLGVLKMKNSELKRAIDDIDLQLSQLAPSLASKLLRKTNSAGDADKMNKLKKEMEALEKENETLQVRLRNADGLGGGIERHIAAREADIKVLKTRNKWLESEIRKNAKRLHDGGKMTFQQQRAALGDELRKEKQIAQVLLDKVTRDTEQAVSAREQAETVLAALSERDPCPDWRPQDAKAVIELRAKIGEKIEAMKGLRVRQRHAANNAASVALADESAKVMAANLEAEIDNMKRQAAELRTVINEGIIKRGGNVLSPNNPAASAAVMGGTGSTPTAATIASLATNGSKAGDTSVAPAVAMPKHGRRSDLDGTNNSVLDTTTGTSTTNSVSRALGIGPRRRDISPQKGANTIAISPSAAPRKVPQPAATKSAEADMWMGDGEAAADNEKVTKKSPQQAVSPPEDSAVSSSPSTKVNGKLPINEDPAWLALHRDDEERRKNNKSNVSSSKTTSRSTKALATNAKETKTIKESDKPTAESSSPKPDDDAPWLEEEDHGKKPPRSSRSHSSSPSPSPTSSRAASTPRSSRVASPSKSPSGSRRASVAADEAHTADNSRKPSAAPPAKNVTGNEKPKAQKEELAAAIKEKERKGKAAAATAERESREREKKRVEEEEKRRKDAEAITAKREKEAEEKRKQKDKEEREAAERRLKKQQEEDEENERRKQKEREAAAAAVPSWEAPDWMRDGEPAASDVKKASPTVPSSLPSSPPAANAPAAAPSAPAASATSKTVDDGDEPDWLKD